MKNAKNRIWSFFLVAPAFFLLLQVSQGQAFVTDPVAAFDRPEWGLSVSEFPPLRPEAKTTVTGPSDWQMPVRPTLPITSCYGPRKLLHVFKEFHKGVDFGAPVKTPVYAVASGKVLWKGNSICAGKTVILAHVLTSGDMVLSVYRHLRDYRVRINQMVVPGQLIALSGASGRKLFSNQSLENRGCISGPHLHVEFKILNAKMSIQKLSALMKRRHGQVGEFAHQINPGVFIPQLKLRCGKNAA